MESVKGKWYQLRDNPLSIPVQIIGDTGFPKYQILIKEYNSQRIRNLGITNINELNELVKISLEKVERLFQTHRSSQSSPKRTEQTQEHYETPEEAVTAFHNRKL